MRRGSDADVWTRQVSKRQVAGCGGPALTAKPAPLRAMSTTSSTHEGNFNVEATSTSVTKPLHLVLLAPGSTGDVYPLLAVCRRLLLDGHYVHFAAHEAFRAAVEATNEDDSDSDSSRSHTATIAPGIGCTRQHDAIWHDAAKNASRPCRGTVTFWPVRGAPLAGQQGTVLGGSAAAELWASQLADYSAAAAAPVDAVLFNWFGVAGVHLAEFLGVPAIALWPGAPLTPTKAFPCPLIPSKTASGTGDATMLGYVVLEALLWRTAEAPINAWRQETLGLAPMRDERGHFAAMARSKCPVLYGFSPSVLPPPTDFSTRVIICGDWRLRVPRKWTPPPRLRQFLERPGTYTCMGVKYFFKKNARRCASTVLRLRFRGSSGWRRHRCRVHGRRSGGGLSRASCWRTWRRTTSP